MMSVKLIRKIDMRGITRDEILNELQEMPELECYRVCIWLCAGPKAKEMASLMIFLGRNKQLYHKVLRWIAPFEYYRAIKFKRPPQELEAHVANGFDDYDDMVQSTRELVCCVA
jgi:hypothetical protein